MVSNNNLDTFKEKYTAKDFDSSEKILNELKDKFDSGVYLYNLGTVKIKQGNLAEGRLYLEKAKELGYYNHNVKNNIMKSKELLGIVELERPETISDTINFYSLNLDSGLYLSITLIFILSLTFLFKKINNFIRIAIFIIAIIPIAFKSYFVDSMVKAVPLVDVDVFEGPSKVFEKTNVLNKGLLVKLINKQEGWSYVIYPEKLQGWIKTDEVEVIVK